MEIFMQWCNRFLMEQEGFPCHVICCFFSRSITFPSCPGHFKQTCCLGLGSSGALLIPPSHGKISRSPPHPVLAPALVFDPGRIPGAGTGTCPGHRYWLGAFLTGASSAWLRLQSKHQPTSMSVSIAALLDILWASSPVIHAQLQVTSQIHLLYSSSEV